MEDIVPSKRRFFRTMRYRQLVILNVECRDIVSLCTYTRYYTRCFHYTDFSKFSWKFKLDQTHAATRYCHWT